MLHPDAIKLPVMLSAHKRCTYTDILVDGPKERIEGGEGHLSFPPATPLLSSSTQYDVMLNGLFFVSRIYDPYFVKSDTQTNNFGPCQASRGARRSDLTRGKAFRYTRTGITRLVSQSS